MVSVPKSEVSHAALAGSSCLLLESTFSIILIGTFPRSLGMPLSLFLVVISTKPA